MGRAAPEYRRLPALAMRLRQRSHRPGARALEPPAHHHCSAPGRRDALALRPCKRAPCRLRWDEEGERRFPFVRGYLAQLLEERLAVCPFIGQNEVPDAPDLVA